MADIGERLGGDDIHFTIDQPLRVIIGGPPHSGKSTLMNLLEDRFQYYQIPVELLDLDLASPTPLKTGFTEQREKRNWTPTLAKEARAMFEEAEGVQVVLGDSVGLITDINEIISQPADVAILLVSGGHGDYDTTYRKVVRKWKEYYEDIHKPLLVVLRSTMNPADESMFDPQDNYGVIVGMDRDAYDQRLISGHYRYEGTYPTNACLEGIVFEIAQSFDMKVRSATDPEHLEILNAKWPELKDKKTWTPPEGSVMGGLENAYYDERGIVPADQRAESFGADSSVYVESKDYSNEIVEKLNPILRNKIGKTFVIMNTNDDSWMFRLTDVDEKLDDDFIEYDWEKEVYAPHKNNGKYVGFDWKEQGFNCFHYRPFRSSDALYGFNIPLANAGYEMKRMDKIDPSEYKLVKIENMGAESFGAESDRDDTEYLEAMQGIITNFEDSFCPSCSWGLDKHTIVNFNGMPFAYCEMGDNPYMNAESFGADFKVGMDGDFEDHEEGEVGSEHLVTYTLDNGIVAPVFEGYTIMSKDGMNSGKRIDGYLIGIAENNQWWQPEGGVPTRSEINEVFGADKEYFRRAEDDLSFKEWADQEMMTHGKPEPFDDWLDDELSHHGDNVSLHDWGNHELDSHYERYGAETVSPYYRGYRLKRETSPSIRSLESRTRRRIKQEAAYSQMMIASLIGLGAGLWGVSKWRDSQRSL